MQHLLTPYCNKIEPIAWWEGAFTSEELDWLQKKAKQDGEQGQAGGRLNTEVRRSEINWMHSSQETSWVYEKISYAVQRLNADYFGFDLTGFGEPLQLTNYHENKKGMYGWHQDFGEGVSRKLSVVLQLSDPSEYEGGNLQILVSGEPINVKKQRGLLVAFPSWTLHQVTPVVSGTRQTLVTWLCGGKFK